jgi:hypothetical protein
VPFVGSTEAGNEIVAHFGVIDRSDQAITINSEPGSYNQTGDALVMLRGCEEIDSRQQIQNSKWVEAQWSQALPFIEFSIWNLPFDSFTNSEWLVVQHVTVEPVPASSQG